MSIVDNDRPPYVAFERRAVEDRAQTNAAGHYVSKDVDFVVLTRPGSRDTVEKEVSVWLKESEVNVKNQRMPAPWLTLFREAYAQWKAGETLPENGTPIKGWPILSPAAQKDLLAAGVRTVEDLAEIPDTDLQGICMGALGYKARAKSWLASAKDVGVVAAKNTALEQTVAELTATIAAQAAELKRLSALIPQPANPLVQK